MRHDRGNDDGFSLIELLMVMIIIGVLAGMAIPSLAAQKTKARVAGMKSSLHDASLAQEALVAEGGAYAPAGAAGLVVLAAQGFRQTDDVTLTIVDDRMTGTGGGYCMKATGPGATDLYLASTGPNAGRITTTACVAS